ncbi:MAG: TlpA family protein disulfide reductase [Spirochaetales bacterium]|nr:TlpA family protein disulfide reductase [Spirochaetales bacterium]
MIKKTGLITLLVFWLLLIISGCEKIKLARDAQSFDFRLEGLDHQRFYLNKQKGKTVVLVFWASWCHSCKELLVHLGEYLENHRREDFLYIGAVCIDPENKDLVLNIQKNFNLTLPILLDSEAKLHTQLGLNSVPITLIFNSKGELSSKEEGFTELIWTRIKKTISRLTSG